MELEEAMAPHSSTLAWKIPWTEEPGRLQSMGSLGVGHDWVTSLSLFTFTHWRRKWQPTPVFLPGESQGQGQSNCFRPATSKVTSVVRKPLDSLESNAEASPRFPSLHLITSSPVSPPLKYFKTRTSSRLVHSPPWFPECGHILERNPLSVTVFANIFSLSVTCLFVCLWFPSLCSFYF